MFKLVGVPAVLTGDVPLLVVDVSLLADGAILCVRDVSLLV